MYSLWLVYAKTAGHQARRILTDRSLRALYEVSIVPTSGKGSESANARLCQRRASALVRWLGTFGYYDVTHDCSCNASNRIKWHFHEPPLIYRSLCSFQTLNDDRFASITTTTSLYRISTLTNATVKRVSLARHKLDRKKCKIMEWLAMYEKYTGIYDIYIVLEMYAQSNSHSQI